MKKRSLGKKMVSKLMMPITKKYLQKPRTSKLFGITLDVPTGIFHPSLFFSTKSMCRFLSTIDLANKKIMEVGSGSGAISIYSAKKQALVFCCDIHPLAVATTRLNAEKNHVNIHVQLSDLFETVKETEFDIILNNPPYYPKNPANMEENAWYAGKDHQYFKRFFVQSKGKLKKQGIIYMVLSSDCDLETIRNIAEEQSFETTIEATHQHLIEKTYILRFLYQG